MNQIAVGLTPIYEPPQSVIAQVVSLQDMPMADLYKLWLYYFRIECPTNNRPTLVRRLAFKIQQEAFEKDKPEIAQKQKERIQALIEHCEYKKKKNKKKKGESSIMPGAILSRVYQGKFYEVICHKDDQYEFEGRIYNSLSPIATEITGTKWSGPRFFGTQKLNKKMSKGR